ncbi:MAG TPA: PDZ domain-containing protein [Planctomycetota bacterium]|jgi:hypothetical protein|nr:PDZ domain-containing protein [Planctomycetota bacterium]
MSTLHRISFISFLLALFLPLQAQDKAGKQEANPKKDDGRTQSYFEFRNSEQGITFRMDNGKVELSILSEKPQGQDGTVRTYKADSYEAFQHAYPELVKKYDLDQIVPGKMQPAELEKTWKEWAKRFGQDEEERLRRFFEEFPKEATDATRDLDRWFEEERHALENLEQRFHAGALPAVKVQSTSDHSTFGILVMPVTDVLRSQLGLAPHIGLTVAEVEKGSLAERSGLLKYDVVVRISGQDVEDRGKFRAQVLTALSGKDFELDILRAGSHRNLTIHPVHS